MFTVLNQLVTLPVFNKRIITVALVAMVVVTVLLLSTGVVVAGPATAGTGHCSC